MESVVHGLAQNNYVVSIANLGGIIAFLVLLFGFTRWAYRFGKAAYRKNIRVAIYRARRRNYALARRAALDLHTFISLVVVLAVALLFATLGIIIGAVGLVLSRVMPPEESISTTFNVSPTWDAIVGAMMVYAPTALFLFMAWKLVMLAWTTRRIRSKLMIRKSRNAAEEASRQQ